MQHSIHQRPNYIWRFKVNIVRMYFTVMQIAIWLGLVGGTVDFALMMRNQALNAHTKHQIDRARFTRLMTDQKGADVNLRKQRAKKR